MGRAALSLALAAVVTVAGCESGSDETPVAGAAAPLCQRQETLDTLPQPESYDYDFACSGAVAASGEALADATVPNDCSSGIWPDLDDTADVCPTLSDAQRLDPVSGLQLPRSDGRPLPTEIPLSESGSFLPPNAAGPWPATLRVVAWNMEYTAHFDEQLALLTSHPELSTADVYLLSEVDRCSARNGMRRAARELAEALNAQYVYGIEFVELEIDRVAGGDTGQAIVSRRPLSGVRLHCHSSQNDWFESSDEPRLGQRVFLHADLPVADQQVRLYVVHYESEDLFGDKRSVQAKELLDQAQALACDRPQIIGGDMNAPYCGAPELDVLRNAGFVDTVGLAGDLAATNTSGFRLDYVFARGFRVLDGGVVRDLGLSDHDALWVDLELEEA
jgi:endonuclease/exonuclease/phosphatase family metal-dependent hydrolase